MAYADRAARIAKQQEDGDLWMRLFILNADLLLRDGQVARAVELFAIAANDLKAPDLINLANQARARLDRAATEREVEHARKVIAGSNKLEQWIAAGEIGYFAGNYGFARKVLEATKRHPCFWLPTNRDCQEAVDQLLPLVAAVPN